MSDALIFVMSATWALAVVLYYFAGKKHGNADGYGAGLAQGDGGIGSPVRYTDGTYSREYDDYSGYTADIHRGDITKHPDNKLMGAVNRLPYDIKIGATLFRKGVKAETLINAAKRWQKDSHDTNSPLCKHCSGEYIQTDKMVEALEFYAKETNWHELYLDHIFRTTYAGEDRGKRAKQALESLRHQPLDKE